MPLSPPLGSARGESPGVGGDPELVQGPLVEACRLGEALAGELIIDCHTHLGPWHNFYIPEHSAASMVRSMDRLGVDLCVCSPHLAIGPDYLEGNREVMAAADAFPGRFVPYVAINPHRPEDEVRREIEHWHALGRLRAFKIHPSVQGCRADAPGYAPLFEHANAHGLPVLSHSWSGDEHCGPAVLGQLARQWPNAKVVIAHSLSSWQMIDEACAQAEEHGNVFLDMTGSLLLYQGLETMVQKVGAARVLLGTDLPFIDPRPTLGRVLMARLADDDKRQILGLNAQALLGLQEIGG